MPAHCHGTSASPAGRYASCQRESEPVPAANPRTMIEKPATHAFNLSLSTRVPFQPPPETICEMLLKRIEALDGDYRLQPKVLSILLTLALLSFRWPVQAWKFTRAAAAIFQQNDGSSCASTVMHVIVGHDPLVSWRARRVWMASAFDAAAFSAADAPGGFQQVIARGPRCGYPACDEIAARELHRLSQRRQT